MLKSMYLRAHYELKLMSFFFWCTIKRNLVSPKNPVLFISCLATVELFPPKKNEDLFIYLLIYIFIYLISLPGISVWNTLFYTNTLLSDQLCVWCILSNKPCELLFERRCVLTCGPEETNYSVIGELAERCSWSKLRFAFNDKHLVLELVIDSFSARYRLCDVSPGNQAKVMNKNSLKHDRIFWEKISNQPGQPWTSKWVIKPKSKQWISFVFTVGNTDSTLNVTLTAVIRNNVSWCAGINTSI